MASYFSKMDGIVKFDEVQTTIPLTLHAFRLTALRNDCNSVQIGSLHWGLLKNEAVQKIVPYKFLLQMISESYSFLRGPSIE